MRSRVLSRADRHDVDAALEAAGVDPRTGLDQAEAERRRAEVGPNELPEPPRVTLGEQVVTQLREPMAILLLVAAAVSGVVLGEAIDAIAIAVIVVITPRRSRNHLRSRCSGWGRSFGVHAKNHHHLGGIRARQSPWRGPESRLAVAGWTPAAGGGGCTVTSSS